MTKNYKIVLAYLFLFLGLYLVGHFVLGNTAGSFAPSHSSPDVNLMEGFRSPLAHLLLQLLVIIIAAQVLGRLMAFFKQPPVIGEVCAGILLGPSALGLFFPNTFNFIFAPDTFLTLKIVSQVGLLFFMFVVGLKARADDWKKQSTAVVFISHASIIIPFAIGLALARYFFSFTDQNIPFPSFALFCGISLSITAFPVLASIIHDRGLEKKEYARVSLACAAIDDVTAWVILAGLVSLVRGENFQMVLLTLISSVAGVIILFKLIAPLLNHLFFRITDHRFKFVASICTLFVSALYFEWTGVHALFGAFLAGMIIPKEESFEQNLISHIEPLSRWVLMPAFFAVTGLRTTVTLIDSYSLWQGLLVIVVAAIVGKLAGATVAARFCGMSWRDSTFIGVLMNTRGLMELIVLNIGLELGMLSQTLFTLMVLMALITTFMTGPCLALVEKFSKP